jgi:tetratricopeptide (TPR) repeat protein
MNGGSSTSNESPFASLASSRLSSPEVRDLLRQRLRRPARRWGLQLADLEHLVRKTQTRTYTPGKVIIPRGARADCLGLVVRGQVAVSVGPRGRARIVVILFPGSTFGETMLERGSPCSATLQSLTECDIEFLRRADLQALRAGRRATRRLAVLQRAVATSIVLVAAMLALTLAVNLQPTRRALAVLPMSIGQWCNERGHDVCTRQAWEIAASLSPTDPNPHLALGTFYYSTGNMAAAEHSFETAQALAARSPEASNNLGLIYARQGKHEQAVPAFQKALELEPGVAATEHNLGLSLQALHRYPEAVSHYESALALGEPQSSILLNMAFAYYEMRQADQAEAAARHALNLDPQLAPAYTLLGALALDAREAERALPYLHRALDLDGESAETFYYIGLAYKSLGQSEVAVAALERALSGSEDVYTRVRIRRHLGELYDTLEQTRVDEN